MLNGKKTYLIMIATLLFSVLGMLIGKIDYSTGVMMILGALGMGGLRDAIKKQNGNGK